jgi:hypothetical protein
MAGSSRHWRIAFAACLSVVAAAAGILRWVRHPDTDSTTLLDVRLVDPLVGSDGTVAGEPGQSITLSFDLRNTSEASLDDLSANVDCQCKRLGEFPRSIGSGQVARVRFRLRVPDADESRYSIPIAEGGKVIATIESTLRPKLYPPHLFSRPEHLRVTAIRGASVAARLHLRTLEEESEQQWLTGLSLDPSDKLSAVIEDVRVERAKGPDVVRRTYHLRFDLLDAKRCDEDIECMATLHWRRLPGAGGDRAVSFPIHVTFKNPFALTPGTITFRGPAGTSEQSAQVNILWRPGSRRSALTLVSVPDWLRASWEPDSTTETPTRALIVRLATTTDKEAMGNIILAMESERDVQCTLPVQFVPADDQ